MMKRSIWIGIMGVSLALASDGRAADIGTAFTYQGHLKDGGGPVTADCDFEFSLYEDAAGTMQVGGTQSVAGVSVDAGVFTVGPPDLDFGDGVFNGTARWLEIKVCCPSPCAPGGLVPLSPRVELKPAPHALALPGLYTQENATSPNVIGGFRGNSVTAGAVGAFIGGGGILGESNRVTDEYGTIGGGIGNQAGDANFSTSNILYATVGGGDSNTASESWSTVGGGGNNTASGGFSTVGGGSFNTSIGAWSNIGGGASNSGGGDYSTIGGGNSNSANGWFSTVPGGRSNHVGGDYSLAAGRRAKANHNGTFVWGDSTDADINSNAANQFMVRSVGGAVFFSNTALTTGVFLAAGGGSWGFVSDRAVKRNVEPVTPTDVLARLADVPIATWNYESQDPSIRHVGPMAQDFHAAFGVGEDERFITSIDADGVALAAIQGLYEIVQEKDCEDNQRDQEKDRRVEELEQQNMELEARLARLEALLSGTSTKGEK